MAAPSTSGAAIISETLSETNKVVSASRWPGWAMIVGGVVGFAAVAADLVYRGAIQRLDVPIQKYFHENASPVATFVFSGVSGLGNAALIVALGIVVGLALGKRKRWRSLVVWAAALIGSGIINPTLKAIFQVPRPERYTFYSFMPGSGYSFPSGHTMAVAVASGALAIVLLHNVAMGAPRRWMIAAAAVAVSLMESLALMVIGVHVLTEVLGALMVSAAWLGVIYLLLPPRSAGVINPELNLQNSE
jgi:undecaprenyl-diphosphatase